MNVSQLINEILTEWAYRIDNGMPNPKNPTHLKELGIVLSEMGLSHIKTELVETLLNETGKTPEKNVVEADEPSFSNPILNKKVTYKSASGEDKEGFVGNLLRQPKGTPARDAAERLLPPEGSPERDELNKELGGEGQPKGEEPAGGAEKGAGEDEKMKQAQAMFDPKVDPAMAARLDKEKEVQAQIAADSEKQKQSKEPKAAKSKALNKDADEVEDLGASKLHPGQFHLGGGYYGADENDIPSAKLIDGKLVSISDSDKELFKSGLFTPRDLGRADKVVKDGGRDLEKIMNDPEIQQNTKDALKKYVDTKLKQKTNQPKKAAELKPNEKDPESKVKTFTGETSGKEIKTVELEGGGFLFGTQHGDTKMADDIINQVKASIPKEKWKDIVFVGEGGATGDSGELEFNDEMKYSAPKFKEMGAGIDTWDGDALDVHNDQSDLYKSQAEQTGLSQSKIKAGNWASMIGQGEGTDTMSPNDYLDDEGKEFLQNAAKEAGFPEIENWDTPTEQDKDTLYRLSFPEDNGDKETGVNTVQVAFNKARDLNLIKKQKELAASGKIPVVLAGESHADLVDDMMKGEQPKAEPVQTEPSAEKPAEPEAPKEPETPKTGEKPPVITPPKVEPKKTEPETPKTGEKPPVIAPPKVEPKKGEEKPEDEKEKDKEDIKKEKPGQEATSSSGQKIYSIGGGYYSDKPNGKARYVRTENIVDLALSGILIEETFALFEKTISATLSNGKKIKVQELPPRAIKKATYKARKAAQSQKSEKPPVIAPPKVEPKVKDTPTQMPKGETPPPGTKKAGVPPPPPPPPPTAKKAEPEKKFEPIPPQDVQKEIPQADPETFSAPSDIPDGIDKKDLDKFNTDISKVQQIVDDAKAKGEKAPDINLCQITVPGTNLYCDDNLGIPRKEMPQFKGKPVPGSKAEKMPLNKDGEVDTEPVFREMLKEKGITTTQTQVPADKLKATQSELGGDKVVGMMGALEKDPNHPGITGPVFVSRDGYVIDGHHRWAAIAAYNAKYPDKQIPMKCEVIDMDIKDAIPMCNKFAEDIGIAAKKQGETTGKAGEEQPKDEPKKVSSVGKFTQRIKDKISKWSKEEKEYFQKGYYKAGSEPRRTLGQTIKDKAKGAWKAVKDGFKHEVKEFKTAGVAVGKLFTKPGGWNDLSHHEKDALKAVGIKIVTTALFGAAMGGLSYGAVGFAKHVAIEFVPHVVAETFLKGAGRAAIFADTEGEAEMDAHFIKFTEMIADGIANMKINPKQMEDMIDSYNTKKEKEMKSESLIEELINEIIVESDWKLAARKGDENGKIVYFKSKEAKKAALAAKTHVDVDKNLNAKKDTTKNEPAAADLFNDPEYQQRMSGETPSAKGKDNSPIPQKVESSLNNGSLDGLIGANSELIKLRDQGIAGAGGPVASYGEAALTTFANTLNDVGGFNGYVNQNKKEVAEKIKVIASKKSSFQNSINSVAKQLGFVLPKDEAEVVKYLAARMVFADNELQRLKADKKSLWYKTGKNGFNQDERAFLEWAKADFDGALSTRRLISEHSKIDNSKPHIVIQSNPKKGGHDEGIVNHLQSKLEEAKKSGNKDDIKHYQNELYCFAKLGFHDTMVVGFDSKGRTTVFSITNKKQDDLQDIWGNTTPEYALNLIKSKFGPDVSNKVVKAIDSGILKVTNSKKATTRLFSEMEIDENFVAICDTPEMKKYMGQLKDHKKFNQWLSENKLKPKNTAQWLQYAQEYATIDESAPYEPFGKFVHKVGELSQNGPFKRKYSKIDFESNSVQTSIQNKNEEKEVVAAVHKQVADEITKADKKLGFPKNGLNGPHTQAYLTTVMHSMHFDLMVENFDGNLGAITGIRGSVPSDFRECLARLSNFKGDIKSKAGRDALNKHLLERCKVNPQTRAIEITNEAGTTVLAEDTWRTAGTSQKVEKKLGGGLRECVSSKVDSRQKKNRQVV